MIRKKSWLLIGGASRRAGKTAFACRVIKNHAGRVPVVGLKISLFKDESAGRAFEILEEKTPSPATDTGRMLEAGARRAYRLQARKENLEAGLEELLKSVPSGAAIVAEGTSVRAAVEPALFILVKAGDSPEEKASYREMLPLADETALFDGKEFDFKPEECLFLEGEWMSRPRASAVVLAGGDSRRMGRDKSLLPVGGTPMIAHIVGRLKLLFEEIAVGADHRPEYERLGLEIIPDLEPGRGPLMALASVLPRTARDLSFVMACDIPDFDLGFVSRMARAAAGSDMVLPVDERGEYEPLFAFYRRSVVVPALEILSRGRHRILDLLDFVRVRTVKIPEGAELRNINTPADYEAWILARDR